MKCKTIKLNDDECLYIIDDFLTSRECANLIKMGNTKGLETYKNLEGNLSRIKAHDIFTVFPIGHNLTVKNIEEKIRQLTLIPIENGEFGKLMKYIAGAAHQPHYDTLFLKKQGDIFDRIATFMIYLNDVEEGGETDYPYLGIKIMPKKGRAVLMFNCKGCRLPKKGEKTFTLPSKLSLNEEGAFHGGGKVYQGEKWIFVKFLHAKPFSRARKFS